MTGNDEQAAGRRMRKKTCAQQKPEDAPSEAPREGLPPNWPQGAVHDPDGWIAWLPPGWFYAHKETSGGKTVRCYISPTGTLCWAKTKVESIVGKSLGPEDGVPNPAAPPTKRLRTSDTGAANASQAISSSMEEALGGLDSFQLKSAASLDLPPLPTASAAHAPKNSVPPVADGHALKESVAAPVKSTSKVPSTRAPAPPAADGDALKESVAADVKNISKVPSTRAPAPPAAEGDALKESTAADVKNISKVPSTSAPQKREQTSLATSGLAKPAQDQFSKALGNLDALAFTGTVAPRTMSFSLEA